MFNRIKYPDEMKCINLIAFLGLSVEFEYAVVALVRNVCIT